ncbi:bis(5'-nucleosyl)-tetraphosphatase (symmetrical) YqeK [Ligilactobacillus agilis]|uniref:bis(5'-nucleosyl)-tetraphosphatase (symmetrical) YqeK n=1 Tax=Ligilactobacillus agilis TaxID=1601 RepID=UPI00254C18A7|nr:bis(5'-nucleosyl)-tetraphosphatase (symmetrical) YqeK [Ligilactobacillus agilis]MDK6809816.1 bis(5'-nucleosyl)-tetraphosphatase (symmetrical) YqeK [Ligilactobacillus agilis]
MNELIYKEGIFSSNKREELLTRVAASVSEYRYKHILGVEQAARKLALRFNEDEELASIAALVHDYAKERSDADFKQVIMANGLDQDLLNWNNFIWHGVVGAEIIKAELNINDERVLNAVRKHTVGAAVMTPLDKIIYVADFIEAGRDFPGVELAQKLAEKDLDLAVAYETKHTLEYLLAQNKTIYPAAILTYNAYVAGKNMEDFNG